MHERGQPLTVGHSSTASVMMPLANACMQAISSSLTSDKISTIRVTKLMILSS